MTPRHCPRPRLHPPSRPAPQALVSVGAEVSAGTVNETSISAVCSGLQCSSGFPKGPRWMADSLPLAGPRLKDTDRHRQRANRANPNPSNQLYSPPATAVLTPDICILPQPIRTTLIIKHEVRRCRYSGRRARSSKPISPVPNSQCLACGVPSKNSLPRRTARRSASSQKP